MNLHTSVGNLLPSKTYSPHLEPIYLTLNNFMFVLRHISLEINAKNTQDP